VDVAAADIFKAHGSTSGTDVDTSVVHGNVKCFES
jgi:hypothetical protein